MNNISQIMRLFFTRGGYDNVSPKELEKHHFIIMRLISIQYPIQVNNLNHKDIPKYHSIMYLHKAISRMHKTTPQWLWQKTNPKSDLQSQVEKLKAPIRYYMSTRMMSLEEVVECIRLNPNGMIKDLKRIEKLLKQEDKEKDYSGRLDLPTI